jgi:pilus assembly protein CpaE
MNVLLRALVIGEKQHIREAIKEALEAEGNASVQGEAVTLDAGMRSIEQLHPVMVFIDIGDDPNRCFAFAEKLNESYPNMAVIMTSEKDSKDLVIRALRCGVSDFLSFPIVKDELERALDKVGRILEASQVEHAQQGKIISLFNSKGGSGSTTLAINLAADIIKEANKKVCVVDLDLQMGDVAVSLDLKPNFTLVDVTNNIQRLDTRFLEDSLSAHSSGIYVLAHPEEVQESGVINPSKVRLVLRLLRGMFDFVIVDTSHTFDDLTREALDHSDLILLVTMLNLPSIRNARRCLNLFRRSGYGHDKVKLVFNRDDKHNEIGQKDAEKVLNYPVYWKLPNDYPTAIESINTGMLIRDVAPRSALSSSLVGLSRSLGGLDDKASRSKSFLSKLIHKS